MKNILNSLIAAFAVYSRIPMPEIKWTEKNLKYSFVFLPLVGAVIGALITALMISCGYFGFHGIFFASTAIIVNILITGGIHLDGFCDVMDAVGSRREREEMLRIMEDPHTGAFAVIYMAALLVVQLGLYTQLFYSGWLAAMFADGTCKKAVCAALLCIFVLSRIAAGISVVTFPKAKSGGLAAMFADGACKKAVCAALLCMTAAIFTVWILSYVTVGVILAFFSALLFLWYYCWSKKRFGGITGDTTGFFINIFETAMLFAVVVLGVVM